MAAFVRVTPIGTDRDVWVNLDHIRKIVPAKPVKDIPVRTVIHLNEGWGAETLHVSQTPEDILSTAR